MAKRKKEFQAGQIDEEAFLQSMNSYWAILSEPDSYMLRKNILTKNG